MYQPALTLTVDNANTTLEAGLCAIKNGQTEIDLAHLTTVDSAGVATLLAWQRAANERHQVLHFRNLPGGLRSLAELYGVFGLLVPKLSIPKRAKCKRSTSLSTRFTKIQYNQRLSPSKSATSCADPRQILQKVLSKPTWLLSRLPT